MQQVAGCSCFRDGRLDSTPSPPCLSLLAWTRSRTIGESLLTVSPANHAGSRRHASAPGGLLASFPFVRCAPPPPSPRPHLAYLPPSWPTPFFLLFCLVLRKPKRAAHARVRARLSVAFVTPSFTYAHVRLTVSLRVCVCARRASSSTYFLRLPCRARHWLHVAFFLCVVFFTALPLSLPSRCVYLSLHRLVYVFVLAAAARLL